MIGLFTVYRLPFTACLPLIIYKVAPLALPQIESASWRNKLLNTYKGGL